ncbi:hypothetical protein SUGI_1447030 [Cryptomeria japonica]|uniref:Uncharacterized protein n=1 Tax=Cryptomeria japonica TaxID=3369 RepID=A0AAD3NSA0_CRYJA|nr:hypothetical protein SUGI_1447030 [Cryptomeria japonica]
MTCPRGGWEAEAMDALALVPWVPYGGTRLIRAGVTKWSAPLALGKRDGIDSSKTGVAIPYGPRHRKSGSWSRMIGYSDQLESDLLPQLQLLKKQALEKSTSEPQIDVQLQLMDR